MQWQTERKPASKRKPFSPCIFKRKEKPVKMEGSMQSRQALREGRQAWKFLGRREKGEGQYKLPSLLFFIIYFSSLPLQSGLYPKSAVQTGLTFMAWTNWYSRPFSCGGTLSWGPLPGCWFLGCCRLSAQRLLLLNVKGLLFFLPYMVSCLERLHLTGILALLLYPPSLGFLAW